jgi:hypothetical protein
MMDWSTCTAVERDPEKVSALFENLEGGTSVEDFLSWFPGIT